MKSVYLFLIILRIFLLVQTGETVEQKQSLDEQIKTLYEQSKEFPQNVELHITLVNALQAAHRFDEGKEILLKFQQLYPGNTVINFKLSQILLILDKSNIESLHLAKECVEKFPNNKEYLEYYGHLQQQFGFHNEAVETIQKLHGMEPENKVFRYQLASALHFSGQDTEAIKHLEDLITDSPQTYSLALAGRIYQTLGNIEKAEHFLKQALDLDPENELAAEELGKLYLELNKPEQAVEYLQIAVEHNPFSVRAAAKFSEALFRHQQRDRAKQIMQRVEYLRTYSEQKRYQLHHLYENGAVTVEEHKLLASEFFQLHLPQKAKPHLQAVVDSDPMDIDAVYSLASLEFQQKNFAETLALLERIKDANHARNDYFQAMLVICLGKAGRIDEAKSALQTAKMMYPNSSFVIDAETLLNQELHD